MTKANPKVDAVLSKAKTWRDETAALRAIALSCGLTEELKWGQACYSFEGSNVVLIQGFKAYCALLFFKGLLLKDPKGILEKTGPNSRVGRQIRFAKMADITKQKAALKAYITQAIAVEKAGLKVAPAKATKLAIPEELKSKLDKTPAFKTAFYALTPGRQRGYILHFAGAKQAKTREARIEKCKPQILKGIGLND